MRKIIVTLIFLLPVALYSQEYLQGHYYNPQANSYAQGFHFNKNGVFDYYLMDDLFNLTLGEGKYQLSDDKLILSYDQMDEHKYFDETKNYMQILDSSIATNSVIYRFHIYDRTDSIPLIGAIVQILDDNMKRIKDTIFVANDSGSIEFSLNKNLFPIVLKASYIGCEDFFFYPQKEINYNISLHFSPYSYYKFDFIKAGTISKFEYEYNTEDSFYIKGKNSNYWTPYTRREINYDE